MLKGSIKSWRRDKGYGFIKVDDRESDVFVHISALRSEGRIPRIGDEISFEIETQDDGKERAINCTITSPNQSTGSNSRSNRGRNQNTNKRNSNNRGKRPHHRNQKQTNNAIPWPVFIIVALCLAALGAYLIMT